MTNSLAARQKWCISHSLRTEIISFVMNDCGMKKHQDVTADLKECLIKKNTEHRDQLLDHLRTHVNPFSPSLSKDDLYNISSGQAVSSEIADFLLNVEKVGEQQRNIFHTECSTDPTRFERTIHRNPLRTFTEARKKKSVRIGGKVVQVISSIQTS